jgi:hypothetical protein
VCVIPYAPTPPSTTVFKPLATHHHHSSILQPSYHLPIFPLNLYIFTKPYFSIKFPLRNTKTLFSTILLFQIRALKTVVFINTQTVYLIKCHIGVFRRTLSKVNSKTSSILDAL